MFCLHIAPDGISARVLGYTRGTDAPAVDGVLFTAFELFAFASHFTVCRNRKLLVSSAFSLKVELKGSVYLITKHEVPVRLPSLPQF